MYTFSTGAEYKFDSLKEAVDSVGTERVDLINIWRKGSRRDVLIEEWLKVLVLDGEIEGVYEA